MSRKVLHLIKLYLSFFVCFIRHAVRSIIFFFCIYDLFTCRFVSVHVLCPTCIEYNKYVSCKLFDPYELFNYILSFALRCLLAHTLVSFSVF